MVSLFTVLWGCTVEGLLMVSPYVYKFLCKKYSTGTLNFIGLVRR